MKSPINLKHSIFFIILLVILGSCQKKTTQESFVILAINDVYRAEGLDKGNLGGLARVKTLRDQLIAEGKKVLLLHAGDFLQPSFSSRINKGAAMIDAMNQLDGMNHGFDDNMIITFGNHEFDKSKLKYLPMMQERIDESQFNWLDSNINWYEDEKLGKIHSNKIHKWMIKEYNGIKVGLFSLTTNMTHPQYIASFDNPIEVSKHYVSFLRKKGVDLVIALTHQRLSDDKKILNLKPLYRPDIIIGGHEHYRQNEQVNGKWIIKADADALSAAVIEVSLNQGNVSFFPTFIDLDNHIPKDLHMEQTIANWAQKTKVKYCHKIKEDEGCLDLAYGITKVDLIAEESEIRRFETNMADFIADTALQEFKLCHADVALINSGSIRLNHNIAANSIITRKHIEGMFPYPSDLTQIQIDGKTLKAMISHSIDMWTANGHWLMISGIRFIHDPEKQQFRQLTYSKSGLPIQDNDLIKVVVPKYLISAKTDHDGYVMIDESMTKKCNKNGSNLKQLVINRIKNTPTGINPQKDGRICNTLRDECAQ